MPVERSRPSRRTLLTAAALLPLTACGTGDPPAPASSSTPRRPGAASPSVPRLAARFAVLEREHGARLGVYAVATGTGASVAYRADERFAFCSTFKTLAVAAVLHRYPLTHLRRRVTYTRADVDSISPVTEHHVATGMTVGQLCEAAIRYSDGTAANLLVRDLGGPARLTAYLRRLGDTVSRMDQYEPQLNRNSRRDARDTTTPRAIAGDYRRLVLGDALSARGRSLLVGWLEHIATGAGRIRAGLPGRWRLADKTGTGDYGRANDVAVVWPPHTAPLVLAVMSDRPGYGMPPVESLITAATREILSALS